MAVKDELREEEVPACVVRKQPKPASECGQRLFQYCLERLAYCEAPGLIHVSEIRRALGTQKIQMRVIHPAGTDPRAFAGIIDMCGLERRPRR